MLFSKVIDILKRKKISNKPTKVSATTHKAFNTLITSLVTSNTITQAVPPARTVPISYNADWKTPVVPTDNKPAPLITAVKPPRPRRRGLTYAVDAKVAAKWAKTKMQCPVTDCGYIVEVEQQIDMYKHLDSKHPLEPCSVCGDRAYSFMTPIERRQHFQTRHPVIRRIAFAQTQTKNHLRALRITPFRAASGAGLKGGADDNDDDDEGMLCEDSIKLAVNVKAKAKKAISTLVPPPVNSGGPSTSVSDRTLRPARHPLPTKRPIDTGIFVNRAASQSVGVTGIDVAHHLEIHWRFCDRCARDHTVLNTEAERNRHDLVCRPGVTEGYIFCAACGNVHGDDDACEGIEGRFCSKCGFGSSKHTVRKHEKHCQGYLGLLCNYCPYCCLHFTAFWSMHIRDNHIRTCPSRPSPSLGMTPFDLYPSYDARDVGNRRKRTIEDNDNAGAENTIPPIKRARQTLDYPEDSGMDVNIPSPPPATVPITGGFPIDTGSPATQTPVRQIQPAQDSASFSSEEIIRDVPINPVPQLNVMMNDDVDIDMTDDRWQPIPYPPIPLRRRSGLQPLPYLLDPNVNNVPRRIGSNNSFSVNMIFTAINSLANPMNDCNFGGVDSPVDTLFSKEEDAKHQSRLQELLSLVSPVDGKFDDDIYSVKLPKNVTSKSLKPPSSPVRPAKIIKQIKKAAKKTKARKSADDGDADYVDDGMSEDDTIVSEAEDHMDIGPVPQVLTKEIPEATITKAPAVKSPVAKTPTIVKDTPKPAPKPKASAPRHTRKARAAPLISIPSPTPAAAPTNDTGRRFPSPTWPRSPQNFTPTDNMFCSRCFKRIPKPSSGKLKDSFKHGDPTYAQQMAAHEDLRKGCGIPHRLGTPNLNGVGLPNRSGWIDWSAKYNGKKLPKSARQMSQAFVAKYPKYKHTVFPANGSNSTQALWTFDPNHPDWSGNWNLPWPPYEGDEPFPIGVDAAPDNGRISADDIGKDVASPGQEAEAAIKIFVCEGSAESFVSSDNMKKAALSNEDEDLFVVNKENENLEL